MAASSWDGWPIGCNSISLYPDPPYCKLDGLIDALYQEKRESEPLPFLKLPLEIRRKIYNFVMVTPDLISPCATYWTVRGRENYCVKTIDETDPRNHGSSKESGEYSNEAAVQTLFTVSKQVGREAMEVYYGSNHFFFRCINDFNAFFDFVCYRDETTFIQQYMKIITLGFWAHGEGHQFDSSEAMLDFDKFKFGTMGRYLESLPNLSRLRLYLHPSLFDQPVEDSKPIAETFQGKALLGIRGLRKLEVEDMLDLGFDESEKEEILDAFKVIRR
ncbi:MAG: hypothetical protein Q9184_005538 [Pyrenodesmia sp. 2 TL-2023]